MGARAPSALTERGLRCAFLVYSITEDAPLACVNPQVVDARFTSAHQPVRVELPQLVAVAAPPLTIAIVTFVLEAHGDAAVLEAPQVLAQRVVEFALPLLRQKLDDLAPC